MSNEPHAQLMVDFTPTLIESDFVATLLAMLSNHIYIIVITTVDFFSIIHTAQFNEN